MSHRSRRVYMSPLLAGGMPVWSVTLLLGVSVSVSLEDIGIRVGTLSGEEIPTWAGGLQQVY